MRGVLHYSGAPYLDKFTLFGTDADFRHSENDGFVLLDAAEQLFRVRLDGVVIDTALTVEDAPLPSGIQELIETVLSEYPYLLY